MTVNDDRHLDAAVRAAEVRRVAAHEADVRRLAEERAWRRMQPLLPVIDPVPDADFPGCVW